METRGLAWPRFGIGFAGVSLAVLAVGLSTTHAQPLRIQFGAAPAQPGESDDSGPSNFASPDRKLLQVLARSKKALEEHRYGEALEGLAEVLGSSEDYLIQPDRKVPTYRGLKNDVVQLLGQMPSEGRDLYEVRSGAKARDRLKRAIASGGEGALEEVSGRFFHTQSGYEATYLLALRQMDHRTPLAAALTLRRLREAGAVADGFEPGLSLTAAACYYQAGMMQQCQQVLVDLKRRTLAAKGTVPFLLTQKSGQSPVAWFDQDSEAPEWLAKLANVKRMTAAVEADQWSMFRGDPSRSAATVGSGPLLNLRWHVDVADERADVEGLQRQEADYRQRGFNVLSGLHPLAIGDYVVMRTATKLLGIDFNTGKRMWEASVSEEEQENTQPDPFNGFVVRNNMSKPVQYGQRIWEDATYGTMSSDGNLVYVVEQLNLGVLGQYNNVVVFGGARNERQNHNTTNCLAAYEIQTGKVRWQLGADNEFKEQGKADTFYLGPPLPLRGQLFVIAEIKDEIRLLCLDPANGGKTLWSQQLAMVEASINQDPVRRLAGVSPSYADGVLICPTGAGCVVAVDLATRSLLWGYVYPREQPNGGRRWRGMAPMAMAFANPQQGLVARWRDGTALIAGGRVLLTPAEADMLYCLSLSDGKPCWKQQARADRYYIACVHQGKVVLVGRNMVAAINLDDGKNAWDGRTVNFSAGANVTGHGFYAGNRYYVPLSSGEVVAVDLDAGKIVATAKSRKGSVPGNLVCYRGRIVSQGLEGVEVYYQLDAARADSARLLAKNADDVEGLTLRGEIALDEGRSSEAVADFRRAYATDTESDSRVRTRELLRDALLDGLRDNFAAHRGLAGELEKLLDEPSQRATYLRYMAMGYQRAGDWQQAVDFCLKLVDMDEKELKPEKIESSYLARRDRWVQARLATIRSEGGISAAAAIDKALAPRLEEAKIDIDALRRFISYFDGQPQAAAARAELIDQYVKSGNVLAAELLLASACDCSGRKGQAALLAEMLLLNVRASQSGEPALRASRTEAAAACYRQLAEQYADVPCHNGLTPSAWLAALPSGDELRKELNRPVADWPKGLVQSSKGETVAFNPYNPRAIRFDMVFSGCRGPFFNDLTVNYDNQQEISFRDGWGGTQKPQPVRIAENGRAAGFYNPSTTVARCWGHLLLVSAGTKIFALDPWRASGNSSGLLWSQDLTDTSRDDGFNGNNVFMAQVILNSGGPGIFRMNPFGPVNARVVVFQRMRNLVAVDPLSGEELWVRQDIPQNSEVFGDEQYVFVVSPGKAEANVYRATDGELLGERKLPQFAHVESVSYGYSPYEALERMNPLANSGSMYLGRNVLTWGRGPNDKGRVLALFDPWRQQAVWPSRTFASGALVDVAEQNVAGVLEPNGHFVLLDLTDGRTICEVQLKVRAGSSATDLGVMRLGDQYIVISQDRSGNNNFNNGMQQMQPPRGTLGHALRRARIYALDLQGKPVWPEPLDIDHQFFVVSQPGRLPVLLFGSFNYEQANNSARMRVAVAAADRRDGRVVYEKNETGPLGAMGLLVLNVEGDPGDKTVRIRANGENILLAFTDKPVTKRVRRISGAKKGESNLGSALWDAVQRAAGVPQ